MRGRDVAGIGQGRKAALVKFTQSVNSTLTKTPWMRGRDAAGIGQGRKAALVEFTQSVNSTLTKTPWMAFLLAAQGIEAEILFAQQKDWSG
jgi:hypothetical protein